MPVTAKPTYLQAVRTLYASVGAGTPTLWLNEVPETFGYPRSMLAHLGEKPVSKSWDPTDKQPIDSTAGCVLDIAVEDDSDVAETLALAVMSVFTPEAIQLTFDVKAQNWRSNYLVESRGERSPSDKVIYHAVITFEAFFGTPY